ncbi:MAG: tetratricopeptide repeat protein [Rubrivivax sp.]
MGELLARDECRLLCLVGPGGVGKTRLARRAFQLLAPAVADAAVFVALEDAETAAQFGQRLAQAAGVAGTAQQRDPLAAAVEAWRTRRLLLVLDNFEQLTPQAPLLDRLLQQCPRLKLVVTSRLRLGLASEWSMPVEGLPWPDAEDGDRIEAFDAVRLFVRAARRVEPGFSAAGESAALVDICRQVAGLPLALELAAAWVRVLSCEEIARELRQGTELLRAADPAHPARHASIDTVFEQSWRRLGEAERQVLARLSVFHGGFTVETARAVAGASLPVLGALADKSLLARERLRMQLHPLVQQLAAQRLDQAGARAATEDAHAAFFQRWLQQLAPAAERGEREALQAIDTEFENGRRAWAVGAARGRAAALLSALPTLRHYVEDRARFEDGLAMMREALHSRAGESDAGLRACLLAGVARMQLRLARYAEAQASAAAALDAATGPAEREARYEAHSVLGGCALALGHSAEARQAYQRALALAKARARAGEIGSTLDNLALCEKRLGHYERALALKQEALAQHRRHGDHARLAVCLNNLGSLCTFMDEDDAARAHLREALALSERHGHVSSRAFVLSNLVELALKSGDDEGAREHAERALGAAREAHLLTLQAWLQVQRGRLAARRGELDTARAALAEAAAQTLALDVQSVKSAVLLGFAELLEAQGRAGAARRLLAYAADEAALSVPDRDELRAAWARRAALGRADPPWPAIGLPELLQRIADEAPQAHAPLLGQLQEAA